MKVCPQCRENYSDDSIFCVSDGATLVEIVPAGQNRVVVSLDDPSAGEVPTQYVRTANVAAAAPDNSKWLYAVIGALATVVLLGGAYVLVRDSGERSDVVENKRPPVNAAPTQSPDLNTNALYTGGVSNSVSNAPVTSTNAVANAMNAAISAANAAANSALAWANSSAASNSRPPRLGRRFNRTYSGTVDDDGIEMYLEKNGSSLTGRVTPRGRHADIYLEGYVRDDGSFEMEEKSDVGVVTGVYRGRINANNTITGVWSKPDGAKTRSMYLRGQ